MKIRFTLHMSIALLKFRMCNSVDTTDLGHHGLFEDEVTINAADQIKPQLLFKDEPTIDSIIGQARPVVDTYNQRRQPKKPTPKRSKTAKTAKPSSPKPSPQPSPQPRPQSNTIPFDPDSDLVVSTNADCYDGYVCLQNKDFGNVDETIFNLDLSLEIFSTYNSAAYKAAYLDARRRWTEVITGDSVPSFDSNELHDDWWFCSNPLPPVVDDLHICAWDQPIDGTSGVVGYGGVTVVFNSETQKPTPVIGIMAFDAADIPDLLNLGLMDDVILHEIGHTIGFGTLWELSGPDGFPYHDLLDDNKDYREDTMANNVWQNDWDCVGTPPIEKEYGGETAFAHWDEECLLDELMTGFISGGDMPLSKLTIASFEDLEYTVSYGGASNFDGSNTACCKTGVGAAPSTQRRTLSDAGRDAAVAYGKKILRERQLPDDVALLLENDHSTGLVYVGDKIVTVLYKEGDNIFDVIVTSKKNDE